MCDQQPSVQLAMVIVGQRRAHGLTDKGMHTLHCSIMLLLCCAVLCCAVLCCAVLCCAAEYCFSNGVVTTRMAGSEPKVMYILHMRTCSSPLCCAVLCCGVSFRSTYGASGAVAICMAGGYKDDEDTGETFTYTGAGGQKQKRQVSTTYLIRSWPFCSSLISGPS
jgi:hypothetical protein